MIISAADRSVFSRVLVFCRLLRSLCAPLMVVAICHRTTHPRFLINYVSRLRCLLCCSVSPLRLPTFLHLGFALRTIRAHATTPKQLKMQIPLVTLSAEFAPKRGAFYIVLSVRIFFYPRTQRIFSRYSVVWKQPSPATLFEGNNWSISKRTDPSIL